MSNFIGFVAIMFLAIIIRAFTAGMDQFGEDFKNYFCYGLFIPFTIYLTALSQMLWVGYAEHIVHKEKDKSMFLRLAWPLFSGNLSNSTDWNHF